MTKLKDGDIIRFDDGTAYKAVDFEMLGAVTGISLSDCCQLCGLSGSDKCGPTKCRDYNYISSPIKDFIFIKVDE